MVNYNSRNIYQWNFIKDSNILFQENAFTDVVYIVAAILYWHQMY